MTKKKKRVMMRSPVNKGKPIPLNWSDSKILKEVERVAETCCGIKTYIAQAIGVSRTTIASWCKKFPKVAEIIEQANKRTDDQVLKSYIDNHVMTPNEKQGDRMQFYLANLHHKYKKTTDINVNMDNRTMNVNVVLNDEQKKEFLDFIDNKE
jgi:hypothetical protein